jgi:hypothetical protein
MIPRKKEKKSRRDALSSRKALAPDALAIFKHVGTARRDTELKDNLADQSLLCTIIIPSKHSEHRRTWRLNNSVGLTYSRISQQLHIF